MATGKALGKSLLVRLKRAVLSLVLFAAGMPAMALDNTQVNDFWDTTGYVNAAPVVADGTMSGSFQNGLSAAAFEVPEPGLDSWVYSISAAVMGGLRKFNSFPPRGVIILVW